MQCLISCEHASNRVPQRYARLFAGKENVLASHASYDAGAAKFARILAKQIHVPVYLGTISRQLVDLNRSRSNRKTLFTQYSRMLEQNERELLLQKYYQPYRQRIEDAVEAIIGKGKPVLHISIHSFTPVKKGTVRKADIGLLYDPARKGEKDLCAFLAVLLKQKAGPLRVRRNYPYLGKTDGFTSFLRKIYPAELYAGLEIEINQAFLLKSGNKKIKTINILTEGISHILQLNELAQLTD